MKAKKLKEIKGLLRKLIDSSTKEYRAHYNPRHVLFGREPCKESNRVIELLIQQDEIVDALKIIDKNLTPLPFNKPKET